MSKLSGLFLIVAGIGAAAYVMPTSETSTERRLADVVQIATNATALPGSQAQPDNKTARFAAPKLIAVREGRTDPANSAQLPATKGGAVIAQAVAPPLAPSNGVPGGRVTVVPSNNPSAQIVPPAPQPVVRRATAPRPGDPDARANLAREIQRELKRVGCYDGDVSAEWTPAAKRAMKSFTDRVNATLPVDEPDHILLTLVQGQSSRACGRSCPTGQSPANDGRCLPTAVLAQVAKRPAQADAGQPAALASAAPRPVVRPAARPADPWQATVRPTVTPPAPASVAAASPVRPLAPVVTAIAPPSIVRPTEPAPGRMALSGPAPSAAERETQSASGSAQAPRPPLPGALGGSGFGNNLAALSPQPNDGSIAGAGPAAAASTPPRARRGVAVYYGPSQAAPPRYAVRSAPPPQQQQRYSEPRASLHSRVFNRSGGGGF